LPSFSSPLTNRRIIIDPDATFRRFVNCVCDDDIEEAEAALDDLTEWINKGGFAPSFPRQIDGSQTPVPFAFIQNLRAVLSSHNAAPYPNWPAPEGD
jgi:hypothetical protein